jgi:phage portal protein BeeE
MGLMPRFRGRPLIGRAPQESQRFSPWDPFGTFSFQGVTYPYGLNFTSPGQPVEEIQATFAGYVRAAYQTNGVIFACMLARLSLFTEARFQFRRLRSGRPGDLFGTDELEVLERPWPNGTTGDLLGRAIQNADLAGNFYARRVGNRLQVMRPDWVSIVLGSDQDPDNPAAALDAEVVGYLYYPGGKAYSSEPIALGVEEVVHFAPIPDPEARFRGMSWLTPILRELQADQAMTQHRQKFFEQGATPNLAIKLDTPDPERFEKWRDILSTKSEGLDNAYKTLYLGAGADVTPIGMDLRQIDFKQVQGGGETRIAAAAGVPPVIVGLSEGLQAATYSNYELAMRRYADLTMRPLWRNVAGSLAAIVDVPGGAELWYDDRDIPALKDDIVRRAEVQAKQAAAAKLLVDGGWEPDSIVDALNSDDLGQLVHSGIPTVQVQQAPAIEPSSETPALPPGADQERALLAELETVLEEAS